MPQPSRSRCHCRSPLWLSLSHTLRQRWNFLAPHLAGGGIIMILCWIFIKCQYQMFAFDSIFVIKHLNYKFQWIPRLGCLLSRHMLDRRCGQHSVNITVLQNSNWKHILVFCIFWMRYVDTFIRGNVPSQGQIMNVFKWSFLKHVSLLRWFVYVWQNMVVYMIKGFCRTQFMVNTTSLDNFLC